VGQSPRVLRAALGNARLGRLLLGYLLFTGAEYGLWIALLVYAYDWGGASAALTMSLVQLLPSAVLAPVLGSLADRRSPGQVLLAGYVVLTAAIGVLTLAVEVHALPALVFALAPLANLSLSVIRPSQAALMPAVVRTAGELTASNVMIGWAEGVGGILGPSLVGALLATSGAAAAIGACAGLSVVSALLVAGVSAGEVSAPAAEPPELRRSLGTALAERPTRTLLALHLVYYALLGALDLLSVLLALDLLGLGQGGAGYLTAVVSAGAVASGLVTPLIIGSRRLAPVVGASMLAAGVALAVLGAAPSRVGAFVVFALVGLSGAVFDVAGRTLLQRAAPPDAIASVFSLLEGLMNVGYASGALVVRLALGLGGPRGSVLVLAAVTCLVLALLWRPLTGIDAAATVPQVEIRLLRRLAIFAPLTPPALEGIARQLVPVSVPAGTRVISEGEPGERYYAVGDGELEVSRGGVPVARLERGSGFGEIALIREVPRTASVTALSDVLLYGLDKAPFLLALTGHPAARAAADAVVAGRLQPGET